MGFVHQLLIQTTFIRFDRNLLVALEMTDRQGYNVTRFVLRTHKNQTRSKLLPVL